MIDLFDIVSGLERLITRVVLKICQTFRKTKKQCFDSVSLEVLILVLRPARSQHKSTPSRFLKRLLAPNFGP